MKILLRVFCFIIFLITSLTSQGQDTIAYRGGQDANKKKTEAVSDKKDTNGKESGQKSQETQGTGESVKQVKSARPDMSRSRGARPPDIVRPSGSRIPKGVGRPAGAGRRGRG
jgi:hypothetical protein